MKYFKPDEFACKCGCGDRIMDAIFLGMLDNAREYAGVPFIINSGKRCEKHNKTCGSTSDNHPSGRAVDIKCLYGPDRLKIVMGLIRAGFRRIGIRKDFIHADTMDEIESMWLY
jgi:zinc D-Ala-D-Ala carboxypeptidase